MSSSSTRSEIVLRALSLAGRGVEIKASANEWLNDLLREWALRYRFPSLRKVGLVQTLATGSTTVALPSDFGAGMAKLGMLFGNERTPLSEKSDEEFIALHGFPSSTTGSGRPSFYMVDLEAGMFRFNVNADQDYPFVPVYHKVPDPIDLSFLGDLQKVWVSNDALVVEGLVQKIYEFTGDDREAPQYQKVEKMFGDWRRGIMPLGGGSSRVRLSSERFRTIKF